MDKNFSKIKKTCLSTKQGFSLIEVLVSLLILSFGLTAIAALMVNNIKGLQTSKNQIIASMLAQEGVEIVRNFKDNGELNTNHPGCIYETAVPPPAVTCDALITDYLDEYPKRIMPPTAVEKAKLNLDSDGFYKHSNSGTDTKFYREINFSIEEGPYVDPAVGISNRVVRVMVYVTWNSQGFTGNLINVNATKCNVANQCVYIESSMPDPII